MRGYIRTFDPPDATVSLAEPKADSSDSSVGTSEIKNTPVGTMRIVAWHEKAGFLTKPEGDEITIREGGPTIKNFEIKAKYGLSRRELRPLRDARRGRRARGALASPSFASLPFPLPGYFACC
jgi:hypothetical protein